jgi:uncharacterized membrane protein
MAAASITSRNILRPPKDLPQDLIWFKWEAYLTFITGMALMVVQFYWNARPG